MRGLTGNRWQRVLIVSYPVAPTIFKLRLMLQAMAVKRI